ncbi:hypothetical protein [Streptomyces sp. H27-D2]|uniref:hypothetical protein n=1 Tax=Streptomyces sp. H27-D2 TaxID=3046304 RepID=UPI002DB6097A|nr:hypothetical protein [Streptomyces sp. H27-D2]MEC4019950.1 hypothetical protein [Streptomyces sp. H27-D2]
MIESVRAAALAADLTTDAGWDRGITDLYRTAEDHGTFHYTFFKALAVNAPSPAATRFAADGCAWRVTLNEAAPWPVGGFSWRREDTRAE